MAAEDKILIGTWKEIMGTTSPEMTALMSCREPEHVRLAAASYRRDVQNKMALINSELRGNAIYGPALATSAMVRAALKPITQKSTFLGRFRTIGAVKLVDVDIEGAVWRIRHSAGLSKYESEVYDSAVKIRAYLYSTHGLVVIDDWCVVPRALSRRDTRFVVEKALSVVTMDDIA